MEARLKLPPKIIMTRITDREIREKLMVSGPEKLSDAELLAVIIREGTDSLSAVGLSEKILAEFPGALPELAAADVRRIRRAAGCGTTKAAQIAAAVELARRIAADRGRSVEVVTSKEDVGRSLPRYQNCPTRSFGRYISIRADGLLIECA